MGMIGYTLQPIRPQYHSISGKVRNFFPTQAPRFIDGETDN